MKPVAAVFSSHDAAARAIQRLRAIGVRDDAINVLAPGMSERAIERVPTDDGEAPGTGATLGAVVGGATGAALGLPVGIALSTLVVPGIGPIIAAGVLGAALFGAGGAAIGERMEDNLTHGVPHDELLLYTEALRNGRAVVITQVESEHDAEVVRATMSAAGAESVDDAWWQSVREDEMRAYAGDFAQDEATYRRGYEAAMLPFVRGRGYDVVLGELREIYPEICQTDAFRCGFERGMTRGTAARREDRAA